MDYTLEQQVQRAEEAQRFLDSDLFREVKQRVRASLMDEWLRVDDEDALRTLRYRALAFEDMEQEFRSIVSDGAVAKDKLEREKLTRRP